MHIFISKSDVIIQNQDIGSGSRWVDPLILVHDGSSGGEGGGVVDSGGEMNTATPGHPDC